MMIIIMSHLHIQRTAAKKKAKEKNNTRIVQEGKKVFVASHIFIR